MEIHILDYNTFKIHQKLMNIIPYITYVHPHGTTITVQKFSMCICMVRTCFVCVREWYILCMCGIITGMCAICVYV